MTAEPRPVGREESVRGLEVGGRSEGVLPAKVSDSSRCAAQSCGHVAPRAWPRNDTQDVQPPSPIRPGSRVPFFRAVAPCAPTGTPIPEALWRMAVGVASKHGVSQASVALRLDYYTLKRRLAATEVEPAKPSTAEFVELSMPASNHGGRCQVEIADALGDTMRIEVFGLCTIALATFVRAVAGREPCSR